MRHRVPALGVEVTRAESQRFASSLLLIHGLWTGSWLWTRFAGYLGHRGWESWAIDMPGRAGQAPREGSGLIRVDDLVAQCVAVAHAMPAAPVVVAHDAGAAVALQVASQINAAAVVLMAPALPGSGALRVALGSLRRAVSAIFGRPLTPPTGPAAAPFFGPFGHSQHPRR